MTGAQRAVLAAMQGRFFVLGRELTNIPFEASKWRRYRSKMPAVDSHSHGKSILLREQSHFDVLRI